nr:hypothetical protein [uncultured Allomuricauda sp.]
MDEILTFITEHYILPFYLLVWLISMACYRTYFDTPLRYYPIYLMYTFLTELLGYFIKFHDEYQVVSDTRYSWYNVIIFNIYSVITFMFFYHIFWQVLHRPKHKKWVKIGAGTSLLGYTISLVFQDPFYSNLYYADLMASMVLLFNVWMYYKEKKLEFSPYPNTHNLMFWTCMGLAVFHLFFPFLIIIGYEAPKIWINYNLRSVLWILILFMYGSFMIGVTMHKRKAFR